MNVPERICAPTAKAARATRQIAREVLKGRALADVQLPLIDEALVSGWFQLHGGRGPGGIAVRCDLVCAAFCNLGVSYPDRRWDALVEQLCREDWGIVSLLAEDGGNVLLARSAEIQRHFLIAVDDRWTELARLRRYARGYTSGLGLEEVSLSIISALAALGHIDRPEDSRFLMTSPIDLRARVKLAIRR